MSFRRPRSYVAASTWIHRFGLVAHPIKDVAIYAMESTGFAPPSGATPIFYNGSQAPPQAYEDGEIGVKTAFLDGRISATFAVFKISETNQLTVGLGLNPQGSGFYVPIGAGVGEGEDADLELSLTSNWQLVAYDYEGHWLDFRTACRSRAPTTIPGASSPATSSTRTAPCTGLVRRRGMQAGRRRPCQRRQCHRRGRICPGSRGHDHDDQGQAGLRFPVLRDLSDHEAHPGALLGLEHHRRSLRDRVPGRDPR